MITFEEGFQLAQQINAHAFLEMSTYARINTNLFVACIMSTIPKPENRTPIPKPKGCLIQ